MSSDIRFIRKNGRIIPIRVKKGSALDESRKAVQESKKTGAAVGAAAGVGTFAGIAYGDELAAAAKHSKIAPKFGMDGKFALGKASLFSRAKQIASSALAGAKAKPGLVAITAVGSLAAAGLGALYGTAIAANYRASSENSRMEKKFGKRWWKTEKGLKAAGSVPYSSKKRK